MFINTCGDLPLSTDFTEASIYASSPNSLFMYDQEKIDMQSSMGVATTCSTVVETSSICDEFDLSTQYEVLQDISNYTMEASMGGPGQKSEQTVGSSQTGSLCWEVGGKTDKSDIYIKTESSDERLTPTLAELNSNHDLLEDIDSYINLELGASVGKQMIDSMDRNFHEAGSELSHKPLHVEVTGQGHGENTTLTQMLASPPLSTTDQSRPAFNLKAEQFTVKTEPSDSFSPGISQPKSFTPMTPVKPDNIVPHNKGIIHRTSTLSTIKEIDISDFTTLQNLLKQSEPARPKVERRRTVSESVVTERRAAQARKRPAATAGLEMDMKWEEIKRFLEIESRTPESLTPPPPATRHERTRYGELYIFI